MPVTQDRLTRLREFGLSEYAARSYLALLDLGIAEARDVSSISKVPQAKIYHVLEQLHDKGLVVILPEFPKKYAPVPFEEYLGRLYDEHTKAARSIEEQRAELAEIFRVMGDTEVGDRGFFTVIRGRRNVLAKIEEMITQSQRDFIVLGTAGTASRAPTLLNELRRARERDVRVRMMTPVDAETVEKLAALVGTAELRVRELGDEEQSAKVAIVVSDSTRAFLIHFVPDDANVYSGKDIGVFTDQEAMVAAIQAIVEPHWARATTYERRRDDLLHGRAPEFTRVYATGDEAAAAVARALEGAREAALLSGAEMSERTAEQRARLESLLQKDVAWRVVMNFRHVAAIDEMRATTKRARAELRHLRTSSVMGQLIVDDREAFFTIGEAPTGSDAQVVIHTNAPEVVRALRTHFDALWPMATPADERRRELEVFPGLQPGDVGIGGLFYALRDGVVVADGQRRITLWNPPASTLFGRDLGQARGMLLESLVAEASREEFVARVNKVGPQGRADAEPEVFEIDGVRADGSSFPMEVTLTRLQTPDAGASVVAIARDITARRMARDAEREASRRIRHAYERMTDAFIALDKQWRLVYRNPTAKSFESSKPDEEVDGQVIWEAYPDLVGTRFEAEFRRAMRDMRPAKFEAAYDRLGLPFEVNVYPSEDGLSVYFRQVAEGDKPAAASRRAGEMFERCFLRAPTPMAIADTQGRFLQANDAFCALVGRSHAELVEAKVLDTILPDDHKAWEEATVRLLRGEASSLILAKTYVGPKGEKIPVRASLSVVPGPEGKPLELLAHVLEQPDAARATEPPAKRA